MAAFVPVASFGELSIEAVANDYRFGIGATKLIWGPIHAGLFGTSDYKFNFGVAAGINFRF